MNKNNYLAGIVLVFLGIAFFLKNYNISVINTLMLLGGLYFLYNYNIKRYQPHFIFGIVLSAAGSVMLLRDLGRLHFEMSGELFFLALGAIFLFFYFTKGITGFIFPGYILPALGIYSLIENNFNDHYMWPSFFILLGLAFYLIYFTAFIHKSSWPLIPGTILILFGLTAFAFVLGIVSIDMIRGLTQYQNYIISGGIVLLGIGLLYKGLKR